MIISCCKPFLLTFLNQFDWPNIILGHCHCLLSTQIVSIHLGRCPNDGVMRSDVFMLHNWANKHRHWQSSLNHVLRLLNFWTILSSLVAFPSSKKQPLKRCQGWRQLRHRWFRSLSQPSFALQECCCRHRVNAGRFATGAGSCSQCDLVAAKGTKQIGHWCFMMIVVNGQWWLRLINAGRFVDNDKYLMTWWWSDNGWMMCSKRFNDWWMIRYHDW